MGFTALIRGVSGFYGESRFGKNYQQVITRSTEQVQFIRKERIITTALEIFEALGIVFAVVAACYYSLTGDLLSNDVQLYALLGTVAFSATIYLLGEIIPLLSSLKATRAKPDSSLSFENYNAQGKARIKQMEARVRLADHLVHSLIAIGALFALILSCHYFRTDNFLSSDTLAYFLMAGGATYVLAPTLQLFPRLIGHSIMTIDILEMRMHAPKQPEKQAPEEQPQIDAA